MSNTAISSRRLQPMFVMYVLAILILDNHLVSAAVPRPPPVRRRVTETAREQVPDTNGLFFGMWLTEELRPIRLIVKYRKHVAKSYNEWLSNRSTFIVHFRVFLSPSMWSKFRVDAEGISFTSIAATAVSDRCSVLTIAHRNVARILLRRWFEI